MIRFVLNEYYRRTGKKNIIKAIYNYHFRLGFRVTCYVNKIVETKNRILKIIRIRALEKNYGVTIGIHAKIGESIKIHHPNGIIIGDYAIIGNNCEIYQQVTLRQKNGLFPIIGDNVSMYPGCKIVGNITIGNNAVIAPNTVVIKDVPPNAIVSGVPAQIIGWRK